MSDTGDSILSHLAEALGFADDAPPPPPSVSDAPPAEENAQDSNQNIVGWVPHEGDNQVAHEGWLTAEEQAARQPQADEAVEEEEEE